MKKATSEAKRRVRTDTGLAILKRQERTQHRTAYQHDHKER